MTAARRDAVEPADMAEPSEGPAIYMGTPEQTTDQQRGASVHVSSDDELMLPLQVAGPTPP